MRNKTVWFFWVVIAAVPFIARAEEGHPKSLAGINVGELAIIQSQTIFFNAQAERAKAQRAINADETTSSVQPTPTFLPQNSLPAPSVMKSPDQLLDLPVVKGIYGSGKRLRATLLYGAGFEVDVDSSSKELPGRYRLAALTLENVTLERDGKRFPLGFSSQPPAQPSTTKETSPGNFSFPPSLPGQH